MNPMLGRGNLHKSATKTKKATTTAQKDQLIDLQAAAIVSLNQQIQERRDMFNDITCRWGNAEARIARIQEWFRIHDDNMEIHNGMVVLFGNKPLDEEWLSVSEIKRKRRNAENRAKSGEMGGEKPPQGVRETPITGYPPSPAQNEGVPPGPSDYPRPKGYHPVA